MEKRKTLLTVALVALAALALLRTPETPAFAANLFNTPTVEHFDDFLGKELLASETGSAGAWDTVETNLNSAIAVDADAANGVVKLALDADSNAEVATLYWGDQRGIDLNKDAYFEAELVVDTLPTDVAELVFGLAGDANATPDSVTESAWFKLDGSGALVLESDDTTNDNNDVAAGVTLVAGTSYVFRIDFSDLSDVRFWVDNGQVNGANTFDMSNLSATEAIMQPYFSVVKASGTGVGGIEVDYSRVVSDRD